MWLQLKAPTQRFDLARFRGNHSWAALLLSKTFATLLPAAPVHSVKGQHQGDILQFLRRQDLALIVIIDLFDK